mgnify:CR=1 FL=1
MMTNASMRTLIEHCPLGLSQHRNSGEFLALSPACTRLLGRSSGELLGKSLLELIETDDSARVRSVWTEVCRTQSEQQLRFLYRRPDGQVIWIEALLRFLAADAPSGEAEPSADAPQILCFARDITTEVAADAAYAERLARAELAAKHRDYLVEMTPGLIWFGPVKPDLSSYHVEFMSDYLFRVTGYTAKQWLETPGFWRSILHPEDRDQILATVPEAMTKERPIGPYRIFASSGRIMWIQSQMRLERDANGVPIRMYGLTLDMTAFQEAQQARIAIQQELAEKARHLLELSTPIIPISDDVLVMPVIGTLDPVRAQHALETVLGSVTAMRARRVIVDLTGVSSVDQSAAAALLRMVRSVRLVGAQVILTGMRGEIARALIKLDIPLAEVTTRTSLRSAIAEFVGQQNC